MALMDQIVLTYALLQLMEGSVVENVIVRFHYAIICMDAVQSQVHVSPIVLRIIDMFNVSFSCIKVLSHFKH